MFSRAPFASTIAVMSLALASCSPSTEKGTRPGDPADASIPASFWSSAPLAGAISTAKARADAKDGETLVVTGRVKDFVEGRAVFTLIDTELKSCKEMEGDSCPTPWDYCCVEPDRIARSTVTVELHDESGRPLRASVKGFHELAHLDLVAVQGKVSRDEAGNVSLVATALGKN